MKEYRISGIVKILLKYILSAFILCLFIFAAYQHQPPFKIKFGAGLDRLYLSNAHSLQTKIEGKSYRRIRGVTQLSLPDTGYGLTYTFTLRALSSESRENPQPFSIYVNKRKAVEISLASDGADISFKFSEGKLKGPFIFFQFVNEGEDDNPPKVILLESLRVEPKKTGLFVLPPAGLLLRLNITLILLITAAAICHKKAAFWTTLFFILFSTIALFFKRLLFLPFTEVMPVIALAALIFILLNRLLLPPILRKLKLNPILAVYELMLVLLFAGFVVRAVVCLYPGTIISDIDFHAHRMGAVFEHGQLFQTSTTPDEKYSFPYPTLLYIILVPFRLITALPNAVLLKWGIALIDSFIPVIIFIFAMKMMKGERAGLIAAAVYSLFPITFLKFQYGNCTDIFSLFTFWLFFATLAFNYKSLHLMTKMILPTILLVIALISHFSTTLFLILFLPLMLFTVYVAYSNQKNNRRVAMLAIIIIAALIASFLIYYIHYISLIKEQTLSVLHSSGSVNWHSRDSMLHRLARTTGSFPLYLGMPLFITFAFCYAAYAGRRRRTPGFLFLTGLLITMTSFAVVSIFTPLSIRWLMPVLPAISLVIGWGMDRLLKIEKGKWFVLFILIISALLALNTMRSVMLDSPYHQIF
jgi:hypothetical protein